MSDPIIPPVAALFWMLLLAHLLADFALQPDWMVRMKNTWRGLLLHVGVHLATLLVVAGSGRAVLWPYLVALAATHLVIDLLKNWQGKVRPAWNRPFYVVDQFLHLASLIGVAAWTTVSMPPAVLPTYNRWLIYACAFVFVSYPVYISERVLAINHVRYLGEVHAQRWSRMAARTALLALLLVVGGALREPAAMTATATLLPYLTGAHRWRALATDCLTAGLSAAVVMLAVS